MMTELDVDVVLELLCREDFDRDIDRRERVRETMLAPPPSREDRRSEPRGVRFEHETLPARSWCWGGAGRDHRARRRDR